MSFDIRNVQLSHASHSGSGLELNRLCRSVSLEMLGKYGLWLPRGDVGLVGGLSNGEESVGWCARILSGSESQYGGYE